MVRASRSAENSSTIFQLSRCNPRGPRCKLRSISIHEILLKRTETRQDFLNGWLFIKVCKKYVREVVWKNSFWIFNVRISLFFFFFPLWFYFSIMIILKNWKFLIKSVEKNSWNCIKELFTNFSYVRKIITYIDNKNDLFSFSKIIKKISCYHANLD